MIVGMRMRMHCRRGARVPWKKIQQQQQQHHHHHYRPHSLTASSATRDCFICTHRYGPHGWELLVRLAESQSRRREGVGPNQARHEGQLQLACNFTDVPRLGYTSGPQTSRHERLGTVAARFRVGRRTLRRIIGCSIRRNH